MNMTVASEERLANNYQRKLAGDGEFVIEENDFSETKQSIYLAGLETLQKQERIGDVLSVAAAITILGLLSLIIRII